jgi:hypothetical protein
LLLEQLESRRLLATITVTGSGDSIAEDSVVTLREAIASANNNVSVNGDVIAEGDYGVDVINFSIPGEGVHTIHVGETGLGPLPNITGPVTIDGYTQPGASENTNSVESLLGYNAALMIELDGTNAGGVSGLTIQGGGNSAIRGLVINRFAGNGIVLIGSSNNVVEGNFIGTDVTGTIDLGNSGAGVLISLDETGSHVGGTTRANRNVISGNNSGGVVGGDHGRFNQVTGNLIGTDRTGTQDLGNSGPGVSLGGSNRDGSGTVVGGTVVAARNIISGNGSVGVSLARASGIFVQGNYIGTDVTGTVAIGNEVGGISLFESGGITIGGATAFAGNVVSANRGFGISAGQPVGQNASSARYWATSLALEPTASARWATSAVVSMPSSRELVVWRLAKGTLSPSTAGLGSLGARSWETRSLPMARRESSSVA